MNSLTSANLLFSTYFQEEIDAASSRLSPPFTSQLHEAEQWIRMQRQLEEVGLNFVCQALKYTSSY